MSETRFYFKDSFMTAMKKVIEGKPVCTGCSMRFFSHKDLEQHLKYCEAAQLSKDAGSEILPADRPSCDICGLVFISDYDLSNHKNSHKDSPFECELCEKRFQRKLSYLKHVKNQHTKMFCELCQIYFTTAKALAEHRRKLHKDAVEEYMSYVCQFCHKHFANSENLREHTKQVHKDEQDNKPEEGLNLGVFMCVLCSRRFNSYTKLREHIASHPGEDQNKGTTKRRKTENGEEKEGGLPEQPLVLQVKTGQEEDEEQRKEPPQFSPQLSPQKQPAASARGVGSPPALSPGGAVSPPPPPATRERSPAHDAANAKPRRLLPTQRFAKGHGMSKGSPVKTSDNDPLPSSCVTSSSNASNQATPKQQTPVRNSEIPTSSAVSSQSALRSATQTRRSPRYGAQSTTLVQSPAASGHSPTVAPQPGSGSEPKPQKETPTAPARPPSKVWQRHLEKMEALATKQKRYERDLQLRKLQSDGAAVSPLDRLVSGGGHNEQRRYEQNLQLKKLQSDTAGPGGGATVDLIVSGHDEHAHRRKHEPTGCRRVKVGQREVGAGQKGNEDVNSQESEGNVESGAEPSTKQRKGTAEYVSQSNGNEATEATPPGEGKKPTKRAPPGPGVSKATQRLQRQQQRREKLIKQHEDLLNQELVEGELPAAVLNEETPGGAKVKADALEIEVKLDDGSTAPLDLDKTGDS